MQGQTIILADPVLNVIEPNITFTAAQYAVLQNQIWNGMIMFGILAMLIGFAIGAYCGWSWKVYYLEKERLEEEGEEGDAGDLGDPDQDPAGECIHLPRGNNGPNK